MTSYYNKYFENMEWLNDMDETWVSFIESVPEAHFWERRAVFKNGLDVDFVLVDESLLMNDVESLTILKEICTNSINIVFDKIDAADIFHQLSSDKHDFTYPTVFEFNNLVSDFYFHYLWAFKKLLRGELWVAHRSIDTYLKSLLLTMLQWHAHAVHGEKHQTYYNGRYLEKWAGKDVQENLKNVFSSYDRACMREALINTQKLFTKKARDFSKRLNYKFPVCGEEKLTGWVDVNYYKKQGDV
ncbi:MAG: aminoglycoside 6-adenylyltransferase [Spirochaetes bacterium]|nr:aminoglycoside 6-adenylyltransferase [Spirochaetota bacterium]MBN2770415.1 aminoglycoside 6-adenylyltransferase [Spirochaetota bacterium]